MNVIEYAETFDGAGNGWIGWVGRPGGSCAAPLEIRDSCAVSRGPWWVDYNHAPPGAGYLHIHYVLHTTANRNTPEYDVISGRNRFIEGGYPRDFRDAQLAVNVRGRMDQRGSQLLLLVQADVGPVRANHVLHAQPIPVTPRMSRQTLSLHADPSQWTCLGSRHDRTATYGIAPIEAVLSDVNVDIILVSFPLDVRPADPAVAQPHTLRAGADYPVDTSRLPAGVIELDDISIRFRK